jgi:CRP/FNR family nitrogen fixation transcriptional regulator
MRTRCRSSFVAVKKFTVRLAEPVDSWYRVLAGSARRFTLRAIGRLQIVDLLLPGDTVGFGVNGKHHFSAETGSAGTVIARNPVRELR